jgi:hypothetical protein
MSIDFFRISRGLELDDAVQFLSGFGAPGVSADTNAAKVGSYYTDQTNGDLWTKVSLGNGTDKWRKLASQNYVQALLATGISWREPVTVVDTTSSSVPVGTPNNPITVDGVSISDGQRVLFAAVTGGAGANVYVYNQPLGTFVEDTNEETGGDTVFVQEGTSSGSTWQYNGTAWGVITTNVSNAELGFIRSYVGKPAAGPVLPDYTSTYVVADNDSHTTAISKLDAAIAATSATTSATNVTSITTIDSAVSSVTEWDVFVREVATPTRIWAGKVFAAHNGAAVDYTNFAILRLNGNINGLEVTVELTGGDTLNLRVSSIDAVNVKAQRLASFV